MFVVFVDIAGVVVCFIFVIRIIFDDCLFFAIIIHVVPMTAAIVAQ
jgi:hypothetical protein